MTDARTRLELQFRPLWQVIGVILIALVVYESLTPHPISVPVDQGDKVGHVLAYATLMFWFAQLHDKAGVRIAWAAAFVALGVLMEFLQALTDYRSFEVADMVADACGVALGWIVAPPRSPHLLEFLESRWPART
jgi:VanZ family protein